MRTTLSQQVQTALSYISKSGNGLLDIQSQVASGKRILRPSDDVTGTNQALTLRSSINTVEQFADNITVSKPLLNATDAAMNDILGYVQQVRTKAIAAATDGCSDDQRQAYAKELDDILVQLMDVANGRHMDQYIFGGTATDAPAVIEQAGPPPFAYAGNQGVRQTQVLSWVSLPVNIPGDRVFNFDGGAGAGTTDVFTMVQQVRDNMLANDKNAISGQLENIDANLDNLMSCSAQVGSWCRRMDSAETVLDETKVRLQQMLSDAEDIDLAQAVVDLKTRENVYQAALAISTRMFELSLATMR